MLDRLTFSWPAATEDVSSIIDYRLHVRDDLSNWIVTNQSTGGATSFTATGLSLANGRKYFGHVVPINGANVNGAPPSPESDGILAVNLHPSISDAKKNSAIGTAVGIVGLFVTCSGSDSPGLVYVEQSDRTAGIRTDSTDTVAKSQCVEVAGTLQLNPQNELFLQNSEVAPQSGSQSIGPLGMGGKTLFGGSYGLQPGTVGGVGVNTTGLLVRSWGRVTYVSPTAPYYFVISDGSNLFDPAGFQGIGVRCGSITPPTQGAYVKVTGVCSYESGYPVILLRQSGDWQ
jgi:hypothetical protein